VPQRTSQLLAPVQSTSPAHAVGSSQTTRHGIPGTQAGHDPPAHVTTQTPPSSQTPASHSAAHTAAASTLESAGPTSWPESLASCVAESAMPESLLPESLLLESTKVESPPAASTAASPESSSATSSPPHAIAAHAAVVMIPEHARRRSIERRRYLPICQ
jgi:hypothetical protein